MWHVKEQCWNKFQLLEKKIGTMKFKPLIQGLKYNIQWVVLANTVSFVVKTFTWSPAGNLLILNNFNLQKFNSSVLVSVAASKLILIFIPSQSQSQALLWSWILHGSLIYSFVLNKIHWYDKINHYWIHRFVHQHKKCSKK